MRITNQKETTDNILGLSPMPFQDQLKIDYSLIKGGEVIFIILNEDGKQVISEKINAIEGFSFYTLNNLSSLPVGVYFFIKQAFILLDELILTFFCRITLIIAETYY